MADAAATGAGKIGRRGFLLSTGATGLVLGGSGLKAAVTGKQAAGALPMPPTLGGLPPLRFVEEPAKLLLDRGWRFHLGDIPFPVIKGSGWSYANAKAGNAQGAAATDYDDTDWPEVALPHDWAILSPPDKNENIAQGYRKRGFAWYRRTIRFEPEDKGKYLEIQFGAIATNATIWFNGNLIEHNFSGYNSIYVDVTSMARFGDDLNTLAIRVDADKMEGWWYEGAGLYRMAWLAMRPAAYIVTDGIHADPRQDADGTWRVPVAVTLGNCADRSADVVVEAVLHAPDGKVIASGRADATVAPFESGDAMITLSPPAPELWSVDDPRLYTVVTRLISGGQPVDERRTRVGFRTLRFDAKQGFFLNGKHAWIKGVCLHQDHAGVGVAVADSLWDFRLRRLKQIGVNAIRFSHNAIASEVLDMCDEMGFLVMAENRNFNVGPEYLAQLEWLVRRDRNHPSVFMWSVFNEEPMQGSHAGKQMVRRMVEKIREFDTSRPTTAALNDGVFAPENVGQVVDVVGFNYMPNEYDRFHGLNPDRPMISSEDTSAFMTRGEYTNDADRHTSSSYDDAAAPWGKTQRESWTMISQRPFVGGAFVWTGFDYHGEPTPYEFPSNSSMFGILDLCGFPKMAAHIRHAYWSDAPVLELAPHWNWPGSEGKPVKVMAATNVERIELMLNGRKVGDATVDPATMAHWDVPYEAGRLEAIGYRGGREVIRKVIETVGAPVRLRITPWRGAMAGDGEDVQPFTIDAVDAQGRHVPTASLPVKFTCTGGSIIGLGNGDPTDISSDQGDTRKLFNGLAQVIVRAKAGEGAVMLGANTMGLKSASARVAVLARPLRGFVPPRRPVVHVGDWRLSRAFAERPDPLSKPASDWATVNEEGVRKPLGEGKWSLLRATVTPYRGMREQGGVVVLENVIGKAELWIDGTLAMRKDDHAPMTMKGALPPAGGERTIMLVLETMDRQIAGIGGSKTVREK